MEPTSGITLVLGGARSGKSEVAEATARAAGPPVTYLATGAGPEAGGAWADRVQRHRRRRPAAWTTVEVGPGGDLPGALEAVEGTALVDSLGPWLAGVPGFGEGGSEGLVDRLLEACRARQVRRCPTVVVSDEVGLGVHPPTVAGLEFRDALGSLNRRVGDLADAVALVVAGRALWLPPS